TPATEALALVVPERSPPGVAQVELLKKRWTQVASFVVALAPPPSLPLAWEVPSPQSASSRRSCTVSGPEIVLDMCRRRVTLLMVAPAGTLPATSKAMTPRRMASDGWFVLPAKKYWPAPSLKAPE